MIAVIFEVWPEPQHRSKYLDVAAELLPLLQAIDGFISVERFQSISDEGKLLSLSFFENEQAVMAWRETLEHKRAQALGRDSYFSDYRLRVCSVLRDYGPKVRHQAPE